MPRIDVILHSPLTPSAIYEVLRSTVDPEEFTFFSPTGFKGNRRLIGEVDCDHFKIRRRTLNRNGFSDVFRAHYAPVRHGTRIEGYFDAPSWRIYLMRIWLLIVLDRIRIDLVVFVCGRTTEQRGSVGGPSGASDPACFRDAVSKVQARRTK